MKSKEERRAEGWGWISASAATMVGWGIVAALGYDVNPGLLFGSFGMGIWKVYDAR